MEELKKIPDFDGYYVSNEGKIYTCLGKGNRHNGKILCILNEVKPRLNKNGYARVYMRQTSTGKRKDRYVHRLVAENFIPNEKNKHYVNHINCIRNDNNVNNLEWVTAKENTDYTIKMGHIKKDNQGKYKSNFNYIV